MPWLLVAFPPIKDLLLWRGVCTCCLHPSSLSKQSQVIVLLYETDDADDVGLVGWFETQDVIRLKFCCCSGTEHATQSVTN